MKCILIHCLIFTDYSIVHLYERDFVRKLAEKHQAAPSEYQVLNALQEKMGDDIHMQRSTKSKKMAGNVIDALIHKSMFPITGVISLEQNQSDCSKSSMCMSSLATHFYSNIKYNQVENSVITLLCIDASHMKRNEKKQNKIFKALISTCDKRNIPIVHESLPPCEDREAASIVSIQHFCYQNRLFVSEDGNDDKVGKKRKHSDMNDKKKRKSTIDS